MKINITSLPNLIRNAVHSEKKPFSKLFDLQLLEKYTCFRKEVKKTMSVSIENDFFFLECY